MPNRKQRAAIAAETVRILETGVYRLGPEDVSIEGALERSKAGSLLYTPAMVNGLIEEHRGESSSVSLDVEVRNETTFAAARRLSDPTSTEVFCLNFASAKNPGGGFLSGSQAQEEAPRAVCRRCGVEVASSPADSARRERHVCSLLHSSAGTRIPGG